MSHMDKATAVREGEGFDHKRVEAYLKGTISGLSGNLVVEQFPCGYSNLTYLIRVGDKEMVLRRPPIGAAIKSAHDMGREFKILSALRPVFPYCPEPLAYTEDPDIMGAPFYVMERLNGIILRKELPKSMPLSASQMKQLCEKLLDVQVELHSIDIEQSGLSFLGKPQGYVNRQVEGWSNRYRNAVTPDAPDFEEVMAWLRDKMPADSPTPTLVHNDYKFDNVVLDPANPTSIIGVLDWEMATCGDPLFDLGNSLAYWINHNDPEEMQMIRVLPTTQEGALTREELVERYAMKTGRDVSNFDYYLCFGAFRLAVIAQQIYQRFYKGLTSDKRFAMLIVAVQVLERAALALIRQSKL